MQIWSNFRESFSEKEDDDLLCQQALLGEAARAIDSWQRLALVSQQATRDLAIAFRLYCDQDHDDPELDIRGDLDVLVRELSDGVAKLEEQIV